MVEIGSEAKREFKLSRYACYLIVQNADPPEPIIANGQTYFAMQTQKQELAQEVKVRGSVRRRGGTMRKTSWRPSC